MQEPVSYEALTAALPKLGFDQSAAEYHGALAGCLCVRSAEDVGVLDVLQAVESDGHDLPAGGLLVQLRRETRAALANPESPPNLLLPPDHLPLAQRATAFGEWCQGFVYGLASGKALDLKSLSADVREIITDLTQFTSVDMEAGDDEEGQEAAYADLVEYARVGVQLVFLELSPRLAPANKSLH